MNQMIWRHSSGEAAERLDHDAHEQHDGRGLGRDREERGDRRRRALVDVGRPHVERHRRTFEGEPHRDEDDADDETDRRRASVGEKLRQHVEIGGAGEAVDQRRAVEQHARGERAQNEIFEPGLGRALAVAREAGHDIERQALQLEREIERDQIVRRHHHHHAGGAEQHQHGKLEARDTVLLVIGHRHHDREARAQKHQHLGVGAETIGDEHAEEAHLARGPVRDERRQHQRQRDRERADREPRDLARGAVALVDAQQQQRHRRRTEEDLGQCRQEIGNGEDRHGVPYSTRAGLAAANFASWARSAAWTRSMRLARAGCIGFRNESG